MPKQNVRIASQAIVIIGLCGCSANYSAIHRSEALDRSDRLITQDAKQKSILRQVRSNDGLTTCIEPSPDALSVFAATASGNLTTPQQLTAAFGGTRSESGANIGLRTQTITILRDQGYRICEAFANRGIADTDYAQLIRRNQILTTASLAIEQLTGAVVGPSAAIGASASLEVDQAAVSAAADKVAAQEKAVAAQEAKVNTAVAAEGTRATAAAAAKQKAEDKHKECDGLSPGTAKTQCETDAAALDKDANTKAGEYTSAQTATKTEQTTLEGEKRALAILNQNLNDARNPEHKSRTASTLNGAFVVSKDIPGVASAVQSIVTLAFSKSYLLDLCQMYWSDSIINKATPRLADICERQMKLFEYAAKIEADAWNRSVSTASAANPPTVPPTVLMQPPSVGLR